MGGGGAGIPGPPGLPTLPDPLTLMGTALNVILGFASAPAHPCICMQ